MRWVAQTALILALGGSASCIVPSLDDLGQNACDLDGGHSCAEGQVCIDGTCQVPPNGECTPNATEPCGETEGACEAGERTCADDATWGACTGETGPEAESCNGADDDCDGDTDEALTSAEACELSAGICGGAMRGCVSGAWETPCTALSYGTLYEATETSCDGEDNDCNGSPDDGATTGGACPAIGVCAGEILACTGGAPGACQAPNFEASEQSCDSLDNDCDGSTDLDGGGNALRGTGGCALTFGVCAGVQPLCSGGGYESPCTGASYGSDFQTSEDRCDGLDNDCDGSTDLDGSGAVLRQATACTLATGVCAGASPACASGSFESPCSAASYGSDYEILELACDNLDNDCDGRTDRSREVTLVSSSGLSERLDWVFVDGGLSAVYADSRSGASRIYFRRFDRSLVPQTSEIELSDPGVVRAFRPSIATFGADTVAVWAEEQAGGNQRLVAARLDSSGSLTFLGGTPRTLASPMTVLGTPRVATAGSALLFAWIDATSSTLQAMVLDGSGNVSTAQTLVTEPLGGGGSLVEQVFDLDLIGRSTPDFVLGWTTLHQSAFETRFRILTPTIGTGTTITFGSAGPVSTLTLSHGGGGALHAAWVERDGAGTQAQLVETSAPLVGGAATVVAGPSSVSLGALDSAHRSDGVALIWEAGLVDSHLLGRTPLSASLAVTATGGAPEISPAVTSDGSCLWIGYGADAGGGFDLFAQAICECP